MAKRPMIPGQYGLFRPESNWLRPRELPDLRGRELVALDSETRDDGLSAGKGPGWCLGPAGYIAGVSWATDGSSGYAPIRHPDSENFDQGQVFQWLSDLLRSGTRVVFHNGPYDLGWFGSFGMPMPENIEDTAAAAVMLDENQRSYNLDDCCVREGLPGKDEALLREAARSFGADPKAELWQLPAKYVGPYAEQDAVATLNLFRRYEPQMRAQEVWGAYRTEMELVPMVVAMRRRGIRVDIDHAEATARHFRAIAQEALDEISRQLPGHRKVTIDDVRSPQWLQKTFSAEGITYPKAASSRADRERGSFQKEWMERHPHWLPKLITTVHTYEMAASKFIENFILGYAHRGRIHAEVHQFKTDDGGTRSQRFSYSDPALQQMSSPDKDPQEPVLGTDGLPQVKNGKTVMQYISRLRIGQPVRQCFLPEEGEAWLGADYSQQEPRLTVHFAYAVGATGADEAVRRYVENPRTDYHQMVAEMTGKPRSVAKILNLGMTYGKGKRSLAEELGVPLDEAERILEDYHHRLPFIKSLETTARNLASNRGYIRLLDGARIHYNLWEGGYMEPEERARAIAAGKKLNPCSREEAMQRATDKDHPWSTSKLRRADTRKALNNLVQGSAARQTKLAMLQCWREGILPLIQMHDELGCSVSSKQQVERVSETMRDAVKLHVPVIVDAEVGRNWGEAKLSWDDYANKYLRAA